MSSPRTIEYEYPRGPEDVVALLSDPTFLQQRCEAAGERNVDVKVEETQNGLRVVVARDREVSLPSFAKHMFQAKNRVTDDTCWKREGDRWVAEYAIRIQGIPGEARGKTTLRPRADGCVYESSFEVTSRVAMFKSKLESFLADRIEESLRANAERNAAALAT